MGCLKATLNSEVTETWEDSILVEWLQAKSNSATQLIIILSTPDLYALSVLYTYKFLFFCCFVFYQTLSVATYFY